MPEAKKNVAFGTVGRCVNNEGLWERVAKLISVNIYHYIDKLIAYDFEKIPQKRREMREIPLFDGIFLSIYKILSLWYDGYMLKIPKADTT